MNEELVRVNARKLIGEARLAALRLELTGDAPIIRTHLRLAADRMEATLDDLQYGFAATGVEFIKAIASTADGTLTPAWDKADEAKWTTEEGGG